MNLYWVTTEDHDEDWFMIASSLKEASRLHEQYEGYEEGDASAQEILNIPDNLTVEAGWPSEDDLLSLGAKYIREDEPRVMEINGKQYAEGMLSAHINELNDNIFESRGEQRLNQTTRTDHKKH